MSQDWSLSPQPPEGPGEPLNPLAPSSLPRLSQPIARLSHPITRGSQPIPRLTSQPRLSQPLSITGTLSARRQAEAVQQAHSELSVLTEQLLDLPDRLRQAGLAGRKGRQLHEAMEAFTELAALAWSGMAEDHFDEVAATPLYRQRAVAATRRVSRLQQEAATSRPLAAADWELPAPSAMETGGATMRVAPLWRFRTRLYQEALAYWRRGLKSDGGNPSVAGLGSALEDLRAAVGFAGMSTAHIVFFRVLLFLSMVVGGFIAAVSVGVAASGVTLGLGATATALTFVALVLTVVWAYAVNLMLVNRISLRFVMGAVRWRLVESESHINQGLLTGWNWIVTTLALVAGLGAIGYGGWLMHFQLASGGAFGDISGVAQALKHALGLPLVILAGTVGVLAVLPLLVALPSLLIYQGMLGREMARGTARPPRVRRLSLIAALPVLAFFTMAALTGFLAVAQQMPTLTMPLVTTPYGRVSLVAPVALGIVVALYLVAVGFPYMLGVRRWRWARLGEVQAQKRDLSSKLDKLPQEPAIADEVTTVQYDVARLQYLKLQEEEFRRARGAPYSALSFVFSFIILAATMVLLDNALANAPHWFHW